LPLIFNFGSYPILAILALSLRPWWFNAILCDPCVLSGE
jgi:hypothetical protein